jgi:rhodanese-like protein
VAVGRLFHTAIHVILQRLEDLGWWALVILGSLLALVIVVKWWQRHRFIRQLRVARVSPDELHAMLERGHELVVLDVRAPSQRRAHPRRIPNAIVADTEEIEQRLNHLRPNAEIILYCT